MRKIVLSTVVAVTLGTISATAGDIKFYTDANGQVFVTPGQGRTELKANPSDVMNAMKSASTQKEELKKELKAELAEELKKDVMADVKKDYSLPFKRITVIDEDSPEFLYGKETHVNMKFVADDNPDMWLKAGVRIQGSFENRSIDVAAGNTVTSDSDTFDAYLRRVRFEVAAGFNKWTSFVMDVRNDKANFSQDGEKTFNVGDAYVKIKKPFFNSSLFNVKLFRAKIDVSRTETVKSARVIAYDRPQVADSAAQFISHNRRGTNAQIYGDWNKKVHYQLAIGDAADAGKLKDGEGNTLSKTNSGEIASQSFFYGGKIRLSPFDGWEETKRTETYFGVGKHFSVGASYWTVPKVEIETASDTIDAEHELVNLEMSAHYNNLFIQGEYFDFKGVVEDFNALTLKSTSSTGWYVTSEYVIPELGYIAPFVRYESWDKSKTVANSEFTSTMAGVNWYLKGNTIKAGFIFQKDEYESGLKGGERDETKMRFTTQFFF